MSEDLKNAMTDLHSNVSFSGGGDGGGGDGGGWGAANASTTPANVGGGVDRGTNRAAYYAGAATVCAVGTYVTRQLATSPATKNPYGLVATAVSGVVTFTACTLAGDAIPRPSR